jgi:DNA-binding transcriptional MerR regulator
MNALTISQLAQFSGVKAHTIRIWEQRYQALTPSRTEGNTRTYSDMDLKRLLNIVSLLDSGYKISELGSLDDENLNALIGELYNLEDKEKPHQFISQLISVGMEFNEAAFQKILSHCFVHFGVFGTYKNVIYPLLNRVGLLWSADVLPPAQEHFMCNLIRQKLTAAIDDLPVPEENSKKWILFLPEDEYHEIGLLFAHYVLKRDGVQVFYLGASVPFSTLQLAIENIKPECLLLFFVHHDFPENVISYLSAIRGSFTQGMIYISGNEKLISQLNLENETQWLRNIDDLANTLV